jgi:hypothetical protein
MRCKNIIIKTSHQTCRGADEVFRFYGHILQVIKYTFYPQISVDKHELLKVRALLRPPRIGLINH